MRRSIGCLLLFCSGLFAAAQVKLSTGTLPANGYAGVTMENLTGSGFPTGTITPANVTVSFSLACNGASVVSATPSSITTVIGSIRKVSFALPATANAGKYELSVQGTTDAGVLFSSSSCSSLTVNAQNAFVTAAGGEMTLNGQPFRFGGGNSYELMYSSHATVDQVLATAVSNQLKVVRTWGWLDIGNADGTNSIRGPSNGFYFQYWGGSAPAYNDGATGLQNLDYEIYRAGQLGLKLIIPFTNNWTDFGGMDQYVKWAGLGYHDDFYTDPTIRLWYEDYISHLLNRVNTFSGVAYKNDPTILAWELANEPRCTGSGTSGGGYPSSSSCTSQTVATWVASVAPFVKSIDSNHLLSVGDEGFICSNPSDNNWVDNCSQGDTAAYAKANGIDLLGFHLYPEGWGQTNAWADTYIEQHLALAKTLGKPAYLGEYGLLAGNDRNAVYRDWTYRILQGGGAGALFWDLAVGQPGAQSAEADGSFDLYAAAPLLETMRNFSQEMAANTELPFAPVADDQWATTAFNQSTVLSPLGNDVAYAGATIDGQSINLDPATAGQQTTIHVYGGQYTVNGATVEFTPDAGFNGTSQASYTVMDSNHHVSNVAYLNVTVKPSDTASELLESFETGTDGWGGSGGTVAQSTSFPTNGTHSLQVNVTTSGWFGVTFPSPIDLSGRPSLSIDVETTSIGGSGAIAFQSGSDWTWCQTPDPWPSLSTNNLNTVTIALDNTLNCGGGTPDLTQVRTFFVYLSAPGTYYLDNLRAAAPVNPNAPVEIESFESGTDGWIALHGNGTLAQSTTFHTDGSASLQITSTGDWFGHNLPTTLNLAGKTIIKWDVGVAGAGTSTNLAIQSGSGWQWCQGNTWQNAPASNTTVAFQLSDMSCAPDLTQIHAMWIYFDPGTFYLDNVRAQ